MRLSAVAFCGLALSAGLLSGAESPVPVAQSAAELPVLDMEMPVYVKGDTSRSDYSGVKVTMPPKLGLQQHPRLYLSRAEIVTWREEIQKTPRGKEAFAFACASANGWLNKPIVLPDPKVPSQLKDRWDPAAKAHFELSYAACYLGWGYQLTDNEALAAKAREILLGYARTYISDYAEHKAFNPHDTGKVMGFRLTEAMWLLPLIQSYDMIYDAKCMTDADRKLIENDLLRAAITFINHRNGADEAKRRDAQNPNWRTEEPSTVGMAYNWVNFYNAAYVQAGIAMGDQDWIDIGAADTRNQIAKGIGEDGMWKEGAIGYQLFARHALIACMEPLARQGVDIYGSNHARVKSLFDVAYRYAYPDRTMPGINDSGRAKVDGDSYAAAFDYGWLRFQDPNYGAAVNTAPRRIIPSEGYYFPTLVYDQLPAPALQGIGSIMFDGLGVNIMRGAEHGSPTYLLMKTAPTGGKPHDHPDNLNLIIYADGDELCGEPVGYAYEDSRHGAWTRPTLSHYSLAVDAQNQAKCAARLVGFYDAGAVKILRGQCAAAYPGVGLDRTVVQMPGYLVDIYAALSKTNHTFDYPLCFRGELDALTGVDAKGLKPMGEQSGYKLFMTQEPRPIQGDWTGFWKREAKPSVNPANDIKVTVLGAGETQVYAGIGADDRQKSVLRRSGTSAIFAAVIEPFKDGRTVKALERVTLEGPVPGYGIKVTRADGGTDLILVRFDAQKERKPAAASTFADGSTDALVAVVRKDASGKVSEAGMLGGTKLASGNKTLTLPSAGISWDGK